MYVDCLHIKLHCNHNLIYSSTRYKNHAFCWILSLKHINSSNISTPFLRMIEWKFENNGSWWHAVQTCSADIQCRHAVQTYSAECRYAVLYSTECRHIVQSAQTCSADIQCRVQTCSADIPCRVQTCSADFQIKSEFCCLRDYIANTLHCLIWRFII